MSIVWRNNGLSLPENSSIEMQSRSHPHRRRRTESRGSVDRSRHSTGVDGSISAATPPPPAPSGTSRLSAVVGIVGRLVLQDWLRLYTKSHDKPSGENTSVSITDWNYLEISFVLCTIPERERKREEPSSRVRSILGDLFLFSSSAPAS